MSAASKANKKPLAPLSEVVAESIAYLKEHEPPEDYYVGFSGGKDSIVTLELCRMAGVRHRAFYSATGIDPPEVVRFIRTHYPEITFLKPPMTFWQGIRKKSPPLQRQRWCCEILKKRASKQRYMKERFGDPFLHRIMGLRAEESYKRANRGRTERMGRVTIYKPIFQFQEWHVWDFIDDRGLAYPSLYDEGFSRVGCMICPFILSKNQTRLNRHRERWPAFYKVFEKVVTDWFLNHRTEQAREAYSNQTPQEYLEAYYRGFKS